MAAEVRQKVAVMDFKTVGDSTDLGEGAAEILRTTLMETGKYTVVERSMLKEALKEQKMSLSGAVDQTTAVGIGKILGAQLVAVGSVVKMSERSYTLNVRFIDVATGEVITGKKLTAKNREDIPYLCEQIVKMLSKREAPKVAEEEEPLPQPIIKPPKPQAVKIEKTQDTGGWALGGLYPGASLKHITSSKSAWELRAQSGLGVFAIGPRYYRYITSTGLRLFWGLEADFISFKGKESKGSGWAAGGFAGGEVPLTNHLGLAMDFGPMYLSLAETEYSQSAGGIEYVFNTAIYWHF